MERDNSVYQLDLQIVGEVSVKSSSQAEKSYQTAKMQTDPEFKDNHESQTTISALTSVEACDKSEGTVPRSSAVPLARMDGTQYVYPGPHFDEASVADFVDSAKDAVLEMLYQNTKSKAFEHYDANWSGRVESVERLMTLTAPHALQGEWHVCALNWNATGTTVAVAYGRTDEIGWCQERGVVCCWNLSRRDVDADQPHHTIELDSYASSLAFHPTQPALLAIGTYSGEVALWTVATGEDPQPLMTSLGCLKAPREAVTQLQWLSNQQEQRELHRFVLCSASQDGKVLFWSMVNKLNEPLANYEIQNKRRCVVGVQAMAFMRPPLGLASVGKRDRSTPGLDNLMLLGVESGDVYRTKPGVTAAVRQGVASSAATAGGSSALEVDYYEPHRGPVNAVDCSPFFRNLFLTASSDGSLKLFSTLERTPLALVEPSVESRHYIYCAQFSPARPAVIACASRSGLLHFYDLQVTRTKPCFTAEAGTDGSPVYTLAFNSSSSKYLATGDGRGRVIIWHLSSELTQTTDLERAAVRAEEAANRTTTGGGSPNPKSSGFKEEGDDAAASSKSADCMRELLGFSL